MGLQEHVGGVEPFDLRPRFYRHDVLDGFSSDQAIEPAVQAKYWTLHVVELRGFVDA